MQTLELGINSFTQLLSQLQKASPKVLEQVFEYFAEPAQSQGLFNVIENIALNSSEHQTYSKATFNQLLLILVKALETSQMKHQ